MSDTTTDFLQVGDRISDSSSAPCTFLPPDNVPAQKATVRVGDRVRVLVDRKVVRVGYAKIPTDYVKDIEAQLQWNPPPTWTPLLTELGLKPPLGWAARKKLADALAYAKAQTDGFGGPERGILVQECPGAVGQEIRVWAVRHHQIGTRCPASGRTDLWSDDYEPGGLNGRRTITVCSVQMLGDFLSGDLEVVERAPRKRRAS